MRAPAGTRTRRSRSRRDLAVAAVFVSTVAILVALSLVCFDLLSALRAYVGAESLWSKGQKGAVYHLTTFARTGSQKDWDEYRNAIEIPLRVRVAREALQRQPRDFGLAGRAFAAAGNDPADVPKMIRLFDLGRRIPFMARAISIWTYGDALVEELTTVADRLRARLRLDGDPADREALLKRVYRIDSQLTPLEIEFSTTLGDAARAAQSIVSASIIGVALMLSGLTLTLAFRVARWGARLEARILAGARRQHRRAAELADENLALSRRARRDELTGLPNRRAMQDYLERQLDSSREGAAELAVLFVDLDGFKQVNDRAGHRVGDELLRRVAARLKAAVRRSDFVARLGGDEFVIVATELTEADPIEQICERILAAVREPLEVAGARQDVSASIGVARYPEHGLDCRSLLIGADMAMYAAKRAGRNRSCIGPAAPMSGDSTRVRELLGALEHREFRLHFQPILSAADLSIQGAEALIRWQHPRRGLLGPAEFIPLAETHGAIIQIGDWVLRRACERLAEWQHAGIGHWISVNLSVAQLQDLGLADRVARCIEAAGIDPGRLVLEITETMAMQDIARSEVVLARLREIGVSIAMDDFGVGYSSLNYLQRLPVDKLKIDRSFISRLTVDSRTEGIVATIIMLAHSMGLSVVAEGVETEAQCERLRGLGCDELQGYLFSRPVPWSELADPVATS